MADQRPAPQDSSLLFPQPPAAPIVEQPSNRERECWFGELLDPRDVADVEEWGHAG